MPCLQRSLANALLETTSPQEIFARSSSAAQERVQKLLEKNATLFDRLGLLRPFQQMVQRRNPYASFMLVHSPFEFVLEELEEDTSQARRDRAYLEEQLKLMVVAPLVTSGVPFEVLLSSSLLSKVIPIRYTNLLFDLRQCPEKTVSITFTGKELFLPGCPDSLDFCLDESSSVLKVVPKESPYLHTRSASYFYFSSTALQRKPLEVLMEDKPTYQAEWEGPYFQRSVELIESAKNEIRRFDAGMGDEMDLFVRGFVVDQGLEAEVPYCSVPRQPGTIEVAPFLLAKREGRILRRGDPLLPELLAGQLIHESRHQKHYYLFRCGDTEPTSCGQNSFIRPEFKEVPLVATWTDPPTEKCLHNFFTLAIAVGSEIKFLESLPNTEDLAFEDREIVEKILKRKRQYLLPLLAQGEILRQTFSDEGEILLERVLKEFRYH